MKLLFSFGNRIISLFSVKNQNRILLFFSKFISVFYRGNSVYCPYCKKTFSRFMPHGVSSVYSGFHRKNAKCSYCGSIERYRLLHHYLESKTDFFTKENKVLEVGPSLQFKKLCESLANVEYTSIDLYSDIATYKMDMMEMGFPEDSFDCVVGYHVLEHVENDIKAMQEIYRILKPGGYAILQVPLADIPKTLEDRSLSDKDREILYRGFDHLRLYGNDYKDRLESVGFKVKVDDYVKHLDEKTVKYYGLDMDEDLYICSKIPS